MKNAVKELEMTLNVQVSITKERLQKLTSKNPELQTGQLLSGVATGLLADLADGGMMIQPHELQQMANFVGDINSADDILDPLEKYAHKYDGQQLYQVVIDPAFQQPIAEWAEAQGRTPEDLFQESVNLIMSNTDWLFDVSKYTEGGVHPLMFTNDQLALIAKVCGKNKPTGKDVFDVIENALVPEEAPVG